MYITVASIKKNLGFKGLEVNDLIIGIPILFFFLVLFCFTPYKLASIVFVITGGFLLIPIQISQKNRMYKILFLIISFLVSTKEFTYYTKGKEVMIFEKNKK